MEYHLVFQYKKRMQAVKINDLINKTYNLMIFFLQGKTRCFFYMVKNPNDVLCTHFILERFLFFYKPGHEGVFCNKIGKERLAFSDAWSLL